MLNTAWKEDVTSPSAGLPQTQVPGSVVTLLAVLEDIFMDKSQQTLSNFYKGSPPKWINYFIAEEQNTLLVRRKGYDEIIKQIRKCQITNRTVSSIHLFHHPGSGGSTLAMQVLWDLRKDFKCAIIKQSNEEPALIAEHIIQLFDNQDLDDKRTLLLLDDNSSEGNLIESLNTQIVEKRISASVPVAIILNTKRKHTIMADGPLNLKNRLSSKELHDFELKEAEIKMKHSEEEMKQFHGFNLMRNNFSRRYVANLSSVKEIVEYARRHETACSTELFSVLALLNSYVPGSFLPISRCLDFLTPQHSQHSISQQQDNNMFKMATLLDPVETVPGENITEKMQFEKDMEPFMDLIVIFPRDEMKSECVRLAHPMIANECLNALAEAGITTGEIAKRFLESCKPNEPPYMVKIIKSLLTKRETVEENQEMFSRLILDIHNEGDLSMCKELFEIATNTFKQDAFFPQAFARFLYIVLCDYDEAENQACVAIARDPENSFLIDTLGQIHKNHLRTLTRTGAPALQILKVADLAIKVFREEEKAAENEQDPNSFIAQTKKISHAFNCRGLLGYIQVANIIFDALTSLNRALGDVLTGKTSVRALPAAKNIQQYEDLIESLQNKVRKKHKFFETYLTYSKPSRHKSERVSVQRDVDVCYSKYLLKHSNRGASSYNVLDRSFAGLFSCLERNYCSSFLEKLTEHTKNIYKERKFDVDAAMKYILSIIILSNKDETSRVLQTLTDLRDILWGFVEKRNIYQSPEFFLLVLLMFWPEENHDQPTPFQLDLSNTVENVKAAFDQKYLKHFRSRYLRPLFFLGQGTGLKRLVHSWKIYHTIHTEDRTVPVQKRETWATLDWGNGRMWQDGCIQNLLVRVNGVFKKQQLFAYAGDKQIPVYTDQSFVSCEGPASFFLGFTIKGPVAYDIKFDSEETHKDKCMESQDHYKPHPTCYSCADFKDLTNWKQLYPEVLNEEEELSERKSERLECYRVSSPAGSYECLVSGLRWVCDGAVSLKYHFADWEPYREDLKRMQFEPCGPLMDITVTSGVLTEVHLPHFACLGEVVGWSSSLNDEVRVLDVQDGGMLLEKCELTRFHAKLLHPTFSPKGLLIKTGFPLKVHCEVLIYQTLTAHLTLHVYLVICDQRKMQEVDRQEKDAVKISKPAPRERLQMKSWYTIETKKGKDDFSSKINPESVKLRHSPIKYCEIYVKNAEDDFELHLINEKNDRVWAAEIRADEYGQTSSSPAGKQSPQYAVQFVNTHRTALIQQVSLVTPIADDLKDLIGNEKYSSIIACKTAQDQMRKLYSFLSGGFRKRLRLYESLQKHEPDLVEELTFSQDC
ncbi:sterile alpha motif domain-containing protein 9-like isoform X1 [Astyanax mexicanus]|uniref:Sterile alpha motif domain-containing protein 9-like n=1 Tax=Astyanax mexicanus TaxID=7994 RepID=A0A8B9LJH1_ASTMX|nr:sterile alpha motif domain-containing protein 9-like isoform X1 [Astyanax mexicanus]